MKNTLRTIFITALGLLFTGCIQPKIPGDIIKDTSIFHDKNKISGMQTLRIPELNIKRTIEIGENLYKKVNKIFYNTYKVTLEDDVEAKLIDGKIITSKWKKHEITNAPLYLWNGKKALCADWGYDYELNKKPIKVCLVDKNDNGYFNIATYSHKSVTYPLSSSAKYTIKQTLPSYNQNSFKYEALYQGKIANKIKISYREFKDNMARPAFTQDIEYELEKDGTAVVGFKGLRIKVLKATNMDITYKVVKDYN